MRTNNNILLSNTPTRLPSRKTDIGNVHSQELLPLAPSPFTVDVSPKINTTDPKERYFTGIDDA